MEKEHGAVVAAEDDGSAPVTSRSLAGPSGPGAPADVYLILPQQPCDDQKQ